MTPSRPYILRALYEWILDNQLTPYVLMNAEHRDVIVPTNFVSDGKIVLNITPGIVTNLEINNEVISFDARFGGVLQHIYAPISAVLAIYSKENGRGMVFSEEEYTLSNCELSDMDDGFEEDFQEEYYADNSEDLESDKNSVITSEEDIKDTTDQNSNIQKQTTKQKGKPFLRVVK